LGLVGRCFSSVPTVSISPKWIDSGLGLFILLINGKNADPCGFTIAFSAWGKIAQSMVSWTAYETFDASTLLKDFEQLDTNNDMTV
jgi:hypothetical protein